MFERGGDAGQRGQEGKFTSRVGAVSTRKSNLAFEKKEGL
jgi:hypothetical protein